MASQNIICLDVGEKRIGVAVADSAVRIAVPFETIDVDGHELAAITRIAITERAEVMVVGYPRNQSGEPTAQTQYVEQFAKSLQGIVPKIVFQDESLTSVMAEEQLAIHKKPYTKGDIDAQAAAIILTDYLETHNA
ncbi:Holliday junction resolvase RuvX [Patescibacteria group bacterium]|nr:MAG: Holliday junction resolvase RuvX [Patescibacteria group bacterium]